LHDHRQFSISAKQKTEIGTKLKKQKQYRLKKIGLFQKCTEILMAFILKKSIEKHGFSIPVYTWIDDEGQKWLLDGTQRKHVLETEGWFTPIPYLVIKAANMATAAERLLAITSQYGTITQEGLDEYIAKFELPEMEITELTNFDGVFEFKIEKEPDPEFEPLEDDEKKDNRLDRVNEIQCPECGFHAAPSGFAEYNDETIDS
jgi:hypothetical protein